MLVFGLRLLVALITFGVGVASALLFGSAPRAVQRSLTSEQVLVFETTKEAPPPEPRYGCRLSLERGAVDSGPLFGGVLNEKSVNKPSPAYPAEARAAGVQGTVTVNVVVDEAGRVSTASAVTGPRLLRSASEDAALRTRFAPTLLAGRPVKVNGVMQYKFVLP